MAMKRPAGFVSNFYDSAKTPNPPFNVTAAAASAESASVSFTAPSIIGGAPITSYVAVAYLGTDAVASSSGSSSPVIVSGLTINVSYTFRVFAVNSYGPSVLSSETNAVTPVPTTIGEPLGGGYYAGKISTTGNGVATHYLVVAPKATGETTAQWKTTTTSTSGTSSLIDGPTNSANMNNSSHPAAQFCEGLTIGGYTDWYLPAVNELQVCYFFLKPGTGTNNTSIGANANAVSPQPVNTNYTYTVPGQTTALDFRTGGSEAFRVGTSSEYWSSTQFSTGNAWYVEFTGQTQTGLGVTNSRPVRAVRRIPI